MKIRPVAAELFHADRRRDMSKLTHPTRLKNSLLAQPSSLCHFLWTDRYKTVRRNH